jgi:D-serine deaminase-like pyridoxal phosphate-dependent protein
MFEWIQKPTLLINQEICRKNIETMVNKANREKLIFRPHFKTHQSVEIGEWFRDFGVSQITVSSVIMAEKFLQAGWKDITIAFPFNLREFRQIKEIKEKCSLNVLIADIESMQFLQKNWANSLGFFIKIDVGNHRVGFSPDSTASIHKILQLANKNRNLIFKGFLAHAGHTYQAKNSNEIKTIHSYSCDVLSRLKNFYKADYPDIIASLGDTPSCSIANDFPGIDEIRPGNFVFYDEMQKQLGSCKNEQIALATACPVVSKNEKRREIVVCGGAVHLSKENIRKKGMQIYGKVVYLSENGWIFPEQEMWVTSLSQEHGKLVVSEEQFPTIQIGDLLGIIPIHSCLTANLFEEYYTLAGKRIKK